MKTDLEINKAVAEKLGYYEIRKVERYEVYPDPYRGSAIVCEQKIEGYDVRAVYNWSRNWGDAGTIIEKYMIGLKHNPANGMWLADAYNYPYFIDKSPLRAAMLCFLEMEIE